eukprot:COSAG01_NODE_226_length_21147_cov_59.226435_15_plen_125_part_00
MGATVARCRCIDGYLGERCDQAPDPCVITSVTRRGRAAGADGHTLRSLARSLACRAPACICCRAEPPRYDSMGRVQLQVGLLWRARQLLSGGLHLPSRLERCTVQHPSPAPPAMGSSRVHARYD